VCHRCSWRAALSFLRSATSVASRRFSGAHMAEETVNASVSSPWGVVATCGTVAACGFIYIVGLLYASPSVLGQTYAEWLVAPASE
jgi:hypothetical protein